MKDITIRRFLKKNLTYFSEKKIEVNVSGADACAIRLNHGSLAIYLCTISYHFSSNPKKLNFSYFDIDLEIEDEKGYVEIKSLTNLKEEEVIAHINDYFFPPL